MSCSSHAFTNSRSQTPNTNDSAAASGWAGWALANPEFGSSVDPITTRGADYAHHITASPPEFEIPAASLNDILLSLKKEDLFYSGFGNRETKG